MGYTRQSRGRQRCTAVKQNLPSKGRSVADGDNNVPPQSTNGTGQSLPDKAVTENQKTRRKASPAFPHRDRLHAVHAPYFGATSITI